MAALRLENFLHRTWDERLMTARYLARQSLAKMPYVPVPVRMKVSEDDEIQFWWSYIVPYFDARRGFFDYWGLDLGAHHGVYSIVAAKKLGHRGTVVAFEPSPTEYRRLRLHVRQNCLSSIRTEPLALGSATSTRPFFQITLGDTTRGGLKPPDSSDQVAVTTVETARLDDYLFRLPLERVDLVKLDVEGGEREVLEGASLVLTKFRPTFICEVLDATTQAWGYQAREIMLMLTRFDFDWFDICSDGSLIAHEIRDHYPDIRNYVAVPKEKC